jgi:hypothetical protein
MRLGVLDGPIGDVLAKMASRRDKTVQWKEGKANAPRLVPVRSAWAWQSIVPARWQDL